MASTETITLCGIPYVTNDTWTFGDYGGYGSAGLSNIRFLLSQCEGHVIEAYANDLRHVGEGCPYGLGEDLAADIRAERPWALDVCGNYGSRQVYIRAGLEKLHNWAERSSNYPLLDDEGSGAVEMEWENEAWEGWLKSDLLNTLPEDVQDEAEALDDEALFECYRAAMDEMNEYPVAENSGVHVDVERIAAAFADIVQKRIAAR